jgi:hypothetical protein
MALGYWPPSMVPKPEVMESRGRGLSECDKDSRKSLSHPRLTFPDFAKVLKTNIQI